MVDFSVHFGQKGGHGDSEPAPTAKLERPEVATPISSAEQGVWVLLELLEGNGCFRGDLGGALVQSQYHGEIQSLQE